MSYILSFRYVVHIEYPDRSKYDYFYKHLYVPEKLDIDRMMKLSNQLLKIDTEEFRRHRPEITVKQDEITGRDIIDIRELSAEERQKFEKKRLDSMRDERDT